MELTWKNADLEIKSVSDDGHFVGLANVTEKVDEHGDIIHEGAYKRTVKAKKGRVYVLKGHDSSRLIGITLALSEDGAQGKGLNIDDAALYLNEDPRNEIRDAREEYVRMKRGAELGVPMGISIGFTIPKGKAEYDDQGIRHIYEVNLWEISTTPFPASIGSMVTGVKQLPALARRIASDCTGPLCPQNRMAIEASVKTLQSLLADKSKALPAGDSAEDGREPDNVLSDPEFHSLMERLGIPIRKETT